MDRKCGDIDICTNATPVDLESIFKIKKSYGVKYGSITIYYKNKEYEITTFRKEKKYKSNRFPTKIEYTNDLLIDLKRRDFIMNTLCLNSNGEYIDLLDAKKDIDDKIINVVGNSKLKIKEDSLRILRAIRFAVTLNFKLSNSLKKSIIKNRKSLKKLSYFRKKEELDKIFSSNNINYGIDLINELKLSKYLELDLNNLIVTSDTIGIWAQIDKNLKYAYTSKEKKKIENIKKLCNEDLMNKYVLYKNDLSLILIASQIKNICQNDIIDIYNNLKIKSRKDLSVNISELFSILNLDKKISLSEVYTKLELAIIYEKIDNTKESIQEFLIKEYKK